MRTDLLVLALGAGLVTACPDPGSELAPCGAGEVRDGTGCRAACGPLQGPFEDDLAIVHVNGSAPPSGDGSLHHPFRSIQRGLDAGAARGVSAVLLAAGTYSENPILDASHDGIVLAGRCAAQVVLDGTSGRSRDGEALPSLQIDAGAAEVGVRDLTLRGGDGGVLLVSGRAVLTGVTVEQPARVGLLVQGGPSASLVLADGVVRAPASTSAGDLGVGASVRDGASLVLRRSTVEGAGAAGVVASGQGSSLVLEDTLVVDTLAGAAAVVRAGASLVASGSTLDGSAPIGLSVEGPGSTAEWGGGAIRGVTSDGGDTPAAGVAIGTGGFAVLDEVLVEANEGSGIDVSGDGGRVELHTVTVAETLGSGSAGLRVRAGAELSAEGGGVVDGEGAGLLVEGGSASLDGVAFARNAAIGALVTGAAQLAGCSLADSPLGLRVEGDGTSVLVDGGSISRNGLGAASGLGGGAAVLDDGLLVLVGVLLEDNQGVAAASFGGDLSELPDGTEDPGAPTVRRGALSIFGATVRQTLSGGGPGEAVGIAAAGGTVLAEDLVVEMTDGVGLLAQGARLSCEGCTVSGLGPAAAAAVSILGGATGSLELENAFVGPSGMTSDGVGVLLDRRFGPVDLSFVGGTINPHVVAGLYLGDTPLSGMPFFVGGGDDDEIEVTDATIWGSDGSDGGNQDGHAVFSQESRYRVVLRDNVLRGAQGPAAVYLHDSQAPAGLCDNTYLGNLRDVFQSYHPCSLNDAWTVDRADCHYSVANVQVSCTYIPPFTPVTLPTFVRWIRVAGF